jgi:aminoglycoside/choline kinase family phosphotransferase
MQGDASTRSYARLVDGTRRAILMRDPAGDTALFARIARHLTGIGLSAPQILAHDDAQGFMLIEDFGDDLLAELAKDPAQEEDLYRLATDVLLHLHQHPPAADLQIATPEYLAQATDLAFTYYAMSSDGFDAARRAFLPVLERYAMPSDVMVLRDYHAENALLLSDRPGVARLGLLDFQDALQGHRAYDLVSLIEDARRDVAPHVAEACVAQYLAKSALPEQDFRASLAVLGAQRNLRILGIFARLAAARNKPDYVDLIPRVWAHLQGNLRHPVLADLQSVLAQFLPLPDADHLKRLKSHCQTL